MLNQITSIINTMGGKQWLFFFLFNKYLYILTYLWKAINTQKSLYCEVGLICSRHSPVLLRFLQSFLATGQAELVRSPAKHGISTEYKGAPTVWFSNEGFIAITIDCTSDMPVSCNTLFRNMEKHTWKRRKAVLFHFLQIQALGSGMYSHISCVGTIIITFSISVVMAFWYL